MNTVKQILIFLFIIVASCNPKPEYKLNDYIGKGNPPNGYEARNFGELTDSTKSLYWKNDISTEVPKAIFDFTQLEYLTIKMQNAKELPAKIGSLKNLKSLRLELGETTVLPNEITQLSKLEFLELEDMPLIESIPEQIGELKNLDYLILKQTKLRTLPESIGNLSRLKALVVFAESFEKLPASIGHLNNLRQINITNEQITPFELPPALANLEKLIEIHLKNVTIKNIPKDFDRKLKIE